MMILYYTSDLDTIYYMYLFRVISVGFLKVSLSCHWYERVLDIVRLEQGLQYLTGTQRVHVERCQYKDMLRGSKKWCLL